MSEWVSESVNVIDDREEMSTAVAGEKKLRFTEFVQINENNVI